MKMPQNELAPYSQDGHVRSLDELRHEVMLAALRRYGGNLSEVSRRLAVGRTSLYRMLDVATGTLNDSEDEAT